MIAVRYHGHATGAALDVIHVRMLPKPFFSLFPRAESDRTGLWCVSCSWRTVLHPFCRRGRSLFPGSCSFIVFFCKDLLVGLFHGEPWPIVVLEPSNVVHNTVVCPFEGPTPHKYGTDNYMQHLSLVANPLWQRPSRLLWPLYRLVFFLYYSEWS